MREVKRVFLESSLSESSGKNKVTWLADLAAAQRQFLNFESRTSLVLTTTWKRCLHICDQHNPRCYCNLGTFLLGIDFTLWRKDCAAQLFLYLREHRLALNHGKSSTAQKDSIFFL